MAHIFHAGDIMGAAHIGIGLDWDGGGGVDGLHDIAALPAITARMRRWHFRQSHWANVEWQCAAFAAAGRKCATGKP